MLREIEESIGELLQTEVGVEDKRIIFGEDPESLPAISIRNLGFEMGKPTISEDLESQTPRAVELLNGTGSKKNFELQESMMRGSLRVEHPQGKILREGEDYHMDYDQVQVQFERAPKKGKENIKVSYQPKRGIVTLKKAKLQARYSIQVWQKERDKADALGHKVMEALLMAEEEFSKKGMEIKPGKGKLRLDEPMQATVLEIECDLEREIQIQKEVGLIEKVEVRSQGPLV